MSNDSRNMTEEERLAETTRLNAITAERKALEEKHGKVWDTSELQAEFEVLSFLAPFCFVRRKSDGIKGSMTFQHMPRFYFDFVIDG